MIRPTSSHPWAAAPRSLDTWQVRILNCVMGASARARRPETDLSRFDYSRLILPSARSVARLPPRPRINSAPENIVGRAPDRSEVAQPQGRFNPLMTLTQKPRQKLQQNAGHRPRGAHQLYENPAHTIRHQVHEMVHIERGGPEQVREEIGAYGSLVPNGRELVATLMVEIDDPVRRRRVLGRLGGFEDTVWIEVGGHTVRAVPETDLDRTTADGKASSVQFLHFPFPGEVITAFSAAGARVTIGIGHGEYQHMAVMPEAMRAALSADFTPDP